MSRTTHNETLNSESRMPNQVSTTNGATNASHSGVSTMKKILVSILVAAAAFVALAGPASATPADDNHTDTWVSYLQKNYVTAQCFKHEGTGVTVHGTATAKTVTLNAYGADWYGNGYALLVVKAGTENTVTYRPTAGTVYPAPDGKDVSHWIVCKAEFVVLEDKDLTPTTTVAQPTIWPATPPCVVDGRFNANTPQCELAGYCATLFDYFTANPTATRVDGRDRRCSPAEVHPVPTLIGTAVVETRAVEAPPVVLAFTGARTNALLAFGALLVGAGFVMATIGRKAKS